MAERFNNPDVWGPRGRGFNMGAVQPEGHVIHLTGQVAWDADEQIVGKGDIDAQTRQCFRNIDVMLAQVGGRLGDIVSLTTYYLDRTHQSAIQKVRAEMLPQGTAPVSTSIIVAGLGHPDFLVELTPIAVIPAERFIVPSD